MRRLQGTHYMSMSSCRTPGIVLRVQPPVTSCSDLQDEMRRLQGVEHAEQELNMLQQGHAIAAAQQEMARLAAADHRAAIAQHEHKLQQMHEAQVLLTQRGEGVAGH